MTLGFMQRFKSGEPTHFREKILAGVHPDNTELLLRALSGPEKWKVVNTSDFKHKLHTIREDKTNRWKAGNKIEMVYRGKNYSILDHFNKGIPELEKCVSVQKIEIKWESFIGLEKPALNVRIDNGRSLTTEEITRLARNDGFKDIEQFCKWFSKDFTGKIIHWSSMRY